MSPSIELSRLRPVSRHVASFLTEDNRPPSPNTIHDLFPQSATYEEDPMASIHPSWKRDLHALLEQPTSSSSAFVVHSLSTFLIVLSALVTVLETVPAFHSISTRFWFGIETSLVALFTVEYIARCFAWSSTWSSFFGWVFCTSHDPPQFERVLTARQHFMGL